MSAVTLIRPTADPAFAYAAGAAIASTSHGSRLAPGTIPGGYSAVAGTVGRRDRTSESFAAATRFAAGAHATEPKTPAWLTTLAAMVLGTDGYGTR